MERLTSKKSNIYKIVISDTRIFDIAYVSYIIKIERYIQDWAESVFKDENYEIIMSRLKIQDEQKTWGTLIDSGTLNLLDIDTSFDIKIYRLHII
jgi:hypothetical protein